MIFRRPNPFLTDVGLLMMRAILGIVFLFHGSQKLFGLFEGPGLKGFANVLDGQGIPAPFVAAVLSGFTEFFGGLLVLVGLWMRIAVIPMVINMLVAVIVVHPDAFSIQNEGMEYALTLAVVLAALGLTGPGRFSVLVLSGTKRSRPPE